MVIVAIMVVVTTTTTVKRMNKREMDVLLFLLSINKTAIVMDMYGYAYTMSCGIAVNGTEFYLLVLAIRIANNDLFLNALLEKSARIPV